MRGQNLINQSFAWTGSGSSFWGATARRRARNS